MDIDKMFYKFNSGSIFLLGVIFIALLFKAMYASEIDVKLNIFFIAVFTFYVRSELRRLIW